MTSIIYMSSTPLFAKQDDIRRALVAILPYRIQSDGGEIRTAEGYTVASAMLSRLRLEHLRRIEINQAPHTAAWHDTLASSRLDTAARCAVAGGVRIAVRIALDRATLIFDQGGLMTGEPAWESVALEAEAARYADMTALATSLHYEPSEMGPGQAPLAAECEYLLGVLHDRAVTFRREAHATVKTRTRAMLSLNDAMRTVEQALLAFFSAGGHVEFYWDPLLDPWVTPAGPVRRDLSLRFAVGLRRPTLRLIPGGVT